MHLDAVCHIDLETQSAVSIRNILEYVNHPSTRVLSAVSRVAGQTIVWIPNGRAPTDLSLNPINAVVCQSSEPPFPPSIPWVSHNAYGFDALIWDRLYPNHRPVKWLDTIPLCRAARLPAALDKVGKLLFNQGKNPNGARIIDAMCTAKYVQNRLWYPVGTSAIWQKLIEYNIDDVLLLEKLWKYVAPRFDEWDLLELDWKINRRGIRFDRKLIQEIVAAWGRIQHDAFQHIAELTDGALTGTDLRSNQKVNRYLATRGVELSTLNKLHLDEELAEIEDIDPAVLEVLRARQTVTRGSKGKVERLAEIAAITGDDRLRHSLVFHGAHTGRWSGRGIQPHNLARPSDPERMQKTLDYYDDTGKLAIDGANPDDMLTELMRPCFCASPGNWLHIGDYSAIEARCLAWLVGEESKLAAYRDPTRDTYKEVAAILFGRSVSQITKPQRQLGKIVELGAGYGMSGRTLAAFCKMAKPKIDLAGLGIDPQTAIKQWRAAAPKIRSFWYDIDNICVEVVKHDTARDFGKLRIHKCGSDLAIRLPSGRSLIYRNAEVKDMVPAYVALYNLTPFTKPTVLYNHPHGYRKTVYGGLFTENVVQAICRDLIADALLRADDDGFNVVLHVHDEIVCDESNDNPIPLTRLMEYVPDWADGFPMKVEVHVSKRYSK